jgi:ABC-2 type transport system ATP-binding protein
MSQPVVQVENLTRMFGNFLAVDHISFEIHPGEVVGYLGPNGCGKTTTIRMLLGLLAPSEGKASVLGYDAFRQSEEVRARSGYMSQKFAIYDELTVFENIQFYGGVYGITSKIRIAETLAHVGLTGHEKVLTHNLSTGWRQRLALGIALVHSPRLLFLDEPTSGVDPTARRAFWDLIYDLSAQGVSVLVTTHYMDEAEYCNRVGMMRDGKLLAIDTPKILKQRYVPQNIWEVYTESPGTSLDYFMDHPLIVRAGLAGDHLRIIAKNGLNVEDLQNIAAAGGAVVTGIQRGEPNLEDVFTSLVRNTSMVDN